MNLESVPVLIILLIIDVVCIAMVVSRLGRKPVIALSSAAVGLFTGAIAFYNFFGWLVRYGIVEHWFQLYEYPASFSSHRL